MKIMHKRGLFLRAYSLQALILRMLQSKICMNVGILRRPHKTHLHRFCHVRPQQERYGAGKKGIAVGDRGKLERPSCSVCLCNAAHRNPGTRYYTMSINARTEMH